jgi:hypothetical protein
MQPPEENSGSATETLPSMDAFTARAEQYAREEPTRAVGAAFVVGIVLTLLPIGSIIAGLLRLAFALIRPALIVLGATKVYEEIQKRQ